MKKQKSLVFLAVVFFLLLTVRIPAAAATTDTEISINYTVLENRQLQTPNAQKILISVGTMGETKLEAAVLTLKNKRTGNIYQIEAEQIVEDAAVFSKEYTDAAEKGVHKLLNLTVTYAGTKTTIAYDRTVQFAVNKTITTQPDDFVLWDEADVETEVMTLNTKGASKKNSDLVVVLDAGHGGSDPGTSGNGLVEKNLTLKIAEYCKKELETYDKIKVYMTRTEDIYLTLDGRVSYAASVGADVIISLHINAFTNSSPNGAEVYYPNTNYRPELSSTGKGLAEQIQQRLVALGLSNRGVKILSSTKTTYSDGSAADYYAIIRGAKNAGFAGLIVEHAFISNSLDASKYLSSDASLKSLGEADAKGIASYYNLKKKSVLPTAKIQTIEGSKDGSALTIQWKKVSKASGYQIFRAVGEKGKFKKAATIKDKTIVSWTDTNIKAGKTYRYKIRAYNEKQKADFSAVQKIKALEAPQITKIKASKKAIKLNWKKSENAVTYQIFRSTQPDGKYEKIAVVKKKVLSYEDKTVERGVKYYYKIRAVGKGLNAKLYSSYGKKKGKKTTLSKQTNL